MYVDAHNGEILMYWNAIAYAFTGNVNAESLICAAISTNE